MLYYIVRSFHLPSPDYVLQYTYFIMPNIRSTGCAYLSERKRLQSPFNAIFNWMFNLSEHSLAIY